MSGTKEPSASRIWHTANTVHVDVRGLSPPEPMVAILRLLEGGEVESVLVAHLDREPIFLYPELDNRGWSHEIVRSLDENDDGVTLRMKRPVA